MSPTPVHMHARTHTDTHTDRHSRKCLRFAHFRCALAMMACAAGAGSAAPEAVVLAQQSTIAFDVQYLSAATAPTIQLVRSTTYQRACCRAAPGRCLRALRPLSVRVQDCEGEGCDDTEVRDVLRAPWSLGPPCLLTRADAVPSPQIQRLECTNSLAANDRKAGAIAQKGSRVTVVGCAALECGAWTCTPFAADQQKTQGKRDLSSVTITCEELQLRDAGGQRAFRAGSCSAIYSLGAPPSIALPGTTTGGGRPAHAAAHVAADAADAHAASARVGIESSSRDTDTDRDRDRDRKAKVSRVRDAAVGVDVVNARVLAELTALGCILAVQ